MITLSPDAPAHVLSDWTEERCYDLDLPCLRDDNGLTVTIPAKPDGLPDWNRFLEVASELRWADGWVVEGARPLDTVISFQWWNAIRYSGFIGHPADIPDCIFNSFSDAKLATCEIDQYLQQILIRWDDLTEALADLSRAMVTYARSLPQQGDE